MNKTRNSLAIVVIIVTVIIGTAIGKTVRHHLNAVQTALTEIVNR